VGAVVGTNLIDGHSVVPNSTRSGPAGAVVGTNLIDGHIRDVRYVAYVIGAQSSAPT